MLVSGKTTLLTWSVFSAKPMANAPKIAEKPVSMHRPTRFICFSGASWCSTVFHLTNLTNGSSRAAMMRKGDVIVAIVMQTLFHVIQA